MVSRDSKVDYFASSLFLLIIIKSSLLAGIWWSVCMLKPLRSLCVLFSRTGAGLCIYHLLVWSNLHALHIFPWITLPTQLCLALYSLCTNLLHLLIMWLIVSSLSPHSLHLVFCWVLSILALIRLVLTALSCAAIKRDAVSLKVSFSWPCPGFLVWDVVYKSFKPPIEWFSFPFLFPSYYHSVVHRVLSIVSGGCNESSFAFLYIVFESLYRCINAVFNAGKFSSSPFSWNI